MQPINLGEAFAEKKSPFCLQDGWWQWKDENEGDEIKKQINQLKKEIISNSS